MHSTPHPDSGKFFRIVLADKNLQAGYDLMIQGQIFELVDWADRIDINRNLPQRTKEVAIMFYAHRCEPDTKDFALLDLSSIVYGTIMYEYEGQQREATELLHERELVSVEF